MTCYAGGVPSAHSKRQALAEPSHRCSSVPGVTWNVNEFLCETAQDGGSGLAVCTSGFDCNCLKVVIVKKAIVFPAFVSLSISCCNAWYSGTDYVVTFCKGVHKYRVPYKAPASVPHPGVQGQTIGPSIFRQADGLKDRGVQVQFRFSTKCREIVKAGRRLSLRLGPALIVGK